MSFRGFRQRSAVPVVALRFVRFFCRRDGSRVARASADDEARAPRPQKRGVDGVAAVRESSGGDGPRRAVDRGGGGGDATAGTRNLKRTPWTTRNGFEVLVGPHVAAERRQVALKLAFAITMHKSQGISMDGLDIDFAGVFEFGQAYVALSRAVGLENTLLRNFSAARVKVDPKVAAFYASLVPSSTFTVRLA